MSIRTFIAIPVEHVASNELSYKVKHVAQKDKTHDIRWLHEEKFHLTIDFIGQLNKEQLPQLETALQGALDGLSGFDFTITSIAYFPSEKRPRVVAALVEESPEIIDLKKRVDQSLAQCGLEKEHKPFNPHITVGRPHKHQKLTFHLKPQSLEIVSSVSEVIIYQSTLSKKGATYQILSEIPLMTE
jgi:2'-5' RNA ligase